MRNVVSLNRDMISSSAGDAIAVEWPTQNEKTDLSDGTSITISDIYLDKIDTSSIINYIERHLQVFRASTPEIAVNNHLCEYKEPQIVQQFEFEPGEELENTLRNSKLIIKVSQTPLTENEIGVIVTSGHGNVVARETAGIERKELGNYLFGEIDVPTLETFESPIEAYDLSRSLQLNHNHPVAVDLIRFIGSKIEFVRKKYLRDLKEKQRDEEHRRLNQEADKIAEILNSDFRQLQSRLREIKTASAQSGEIVTKNSRVEKVGDEVDTWVLGGDELGTVDQKEPQNNEGGGNKGRDKPDILPGAEKDEDGDFPVKAVGGSGSQSKTGKGGFQVEYRELGENETRSMYDALALKIIINLSHPVVTAARKNRVTAKSALEEFKEVTSVPACT